MALDWENAIMEGRKARQAQDRAQWQLGDLALQVTTRYGEHSLWDYADMIELPYKTLLDYRRVSAAYKFSERSENLSWSHHQVIAAREDRMQWVEQAVEKKWSVRDLIREVHRADEARSLQERQDQQALVEAADGGVVDYREDGGVGEGEGPAAGPPATSYPPIVKLRSPGPVRLRPSGFFADAARQREARIVGAAVRELSHYAGLSETDLADLLEKMGKGEGPTLEQVREARDLVTRMLDQLQVVGSQAVPKPQ